ncbi:hypothetical protein PsorP6_009530 [Peronosclerospora sorghi]|uniref:Uncharacterized protein n=1 Tax=Peronosclerospora sorghi TaxID=230839 RepID=A0ACC0W1U4_9STRA|nr:hypothetical protein PsorP6_009530 [Peronosclerospora sorghi]
MVYDLGVTLDTVKDTQAYMKAITNHHNELIASTLNRITWWTLAEILVLMAVSMAQISYLRRTLEQSKEQAGTMADKLSVADKPSVASGSKAMPIDSEAMSAFIKAQKIIQNLDLRYNGENGAGEKNFIEELEINDYPQQARWRVTQKEASDSVAELTGAAVIARGSYIPAGTETVPKGSTQASVIEAKRELQRILDETTLQVGLGGDKYAKYSL